VDPSAAKASPLKLWELFALLREILLVEMDTRWTFLESLDGRGRFGKHADGIFSDFLRFTVDYGPSPASVSSPNATLPTLFLIL